MNTQSADIVRLYVKRGVYGWVVCTDGLPAPTVSRHATQQQAIDAAKRRAAPLRGSVVWDTGCGRQVIDYAINDGG